MIEKIKKYICAVCGQEYDSLEKVIECQTKYVKPEPKYATGDEVSFVQNRNSILGTIVTYMHAKPANLPQRKPHSIVYLIKIEKYNDIEYSPTDFHFTTAGEDELEPILEAELIIEP